MQQRVILSERKMNISNELLKYEAQTKEQALAVAEYGLSSENALAELMRCLLSEDVRLAQRAAWSVSWVAQKRSESITPYIGLLVSQLEKPLVHNAITRNSLRILQKIEIPDMYHGQLLNVCFNFIQNRATAIAIKAFSLQILFNLSKHYPEIRNELRLIIQENMDYESAAFRSKGKHILAKLQHNQVKDTLR